MREYALNASGRTVVAESLKIVFELLALKLMSAAAAFPSSLQTA